MPTTRNDSPEPYAHLVDPDYYETHGYPHEDWRELRAKSPVHFVERAQGDSFWALTRLDDITEVSKQPAVFSNEMPVVRDQAALDAPPSEMPPNVITMDPPIHQKYRELVSKRMTPRKVSRFHDDIEEIAVRILADMEQHEGEVVDFVDLVAAPLPIAVIAYLLGVPMDDWRKIYKWTNESAGGSDPEYRQPGETEQETRNRATREQFMYFAELRDQRLAEPKDDLVTLLADAQVDGEPLPVLDILSFYQILVSAGNETTRNATSGGLLAMIEHPDEMRRVQEDPSLLKPAVEEILRWTSPVIHFNRIAMRDAQVGGQQVAAGDNIGMFYPSANRDERIWEDPETFRVDRKRNPHIAFGVGEHYCLGAHVARLELNVIFRHLLPRLAEVELAGPVDRLRSNIIGGVKRLPIRYKLKPAA